METRGGNDRKFNDDGREWVCALGYGDAVFGTRMGILLSHDSRCVLSFPRPSPLAVLFCKTPWHEMKLKRS